jgi:lysozyme
LTEQFEGCRLTAYMDPLRPGLWTIGYGHTGPEVHTGLVWTQEQAEAALEKDVQWAVSEISRLVRVPLTQGEFDALVDFTFNVGSGNFAASTMLKLLNAGQHQAAAAQFELWDKAGGKAVAGLLRRRQAEVALFGSTA